MLHLLQVRCEDDTVSLKPPSLPRVIPNYTLRLCAPVVLHNLLPYTIHYSLEVCFAFQLLQLVDACPLLCFSGFVHFILDRMLSLAKMQRCL